MGRGRGQESHSGRLSIWKWNTLAQSKYQAYENIYVYINKQTKNFAINTVARVFNINIEWTVSIYGTNKVDPSKVSFILQIHQAYNM